ncbi:hypothetical protein AMJ49_04435 [Parcubacteria bacterium DG_74_2]|nr:MAG: hypothetical protein AMJ49_04435 [Parcubacteria bacterium DG_74_2]
MKILWLNWKDRKNPLAGGAEIVTEELLKRLVKDSHQVTLLTSKFKGAKEKEIIDGYEIIRVGSKWTVYWQAYRYYKKHLAGWADLVIDEVNTIPFFAKYYVHPVKSILFIHQLCRQIWFYEMFFPLNIIGYLLEPIYLWLLRDRQVITVSQSTKNDLVKHGFNEKKIDVISEGIEIEPIESLEKISKYNKPTILSLGAIRPMKRTEQIIKAFSIAKKEIKDLELLIAGDVNDRYGRKILKMIDSAPYRNSIRCLGRVGQERKIELMQKSHLICATSVKEGWGLIVTEANSQGTPAIVYDVDGLRDSVKHNETGIICQKNNPKNLARNIIDLLNNQQKYQVLRKNAWQWSKEINFKKSVQEFERIIKQTKNQ